MWGKNHAPPYCIVWPAEATVSSEHVLFAVAKFPISLLFSEFVLRWS